MPDFKTVLLLVALGGTNALQYLGFAVPAQTTTAEVTANSDFMRDQLDSCLAELKACYADCSRTSSQPAVEWEAEVPYPEQLVR
jgi:hypothetical protein